MGKRRTASISSRNLIDAVLRVERMGFDARVQLADEVHAEQPNLFFSVLVLQRYGATLAQIEVVLNPGGHPNSPTHGHLKFPHPDRASMRH